MEIDDITGIELVNKNEETIIQIPIEDVNNITIACAEPDENKFTPEEIIILRDIMEEKIRELSITVNHETANYYKQCAPIYNKLVNKVKENENNEKV